MTTHSTAWPFNSSINDQRFGPLGHGRQTALHARRMDEEVKELLADVNADALTGGGANRAYPLKMRAQGSSNCQESNIKKGVSWPMGGLSSHGR